MLDAGDHRGAPDRLLAEQSTAARRASVHAIAGARRSVRAGAVRDVQVVAHGAPSERSRLLAEQHVAQRAGDDPAPVAVATGRRGSRSASIATRRAVRRPVAARHQLGGGLRRVVGLLRHELACPPRTAAGPARHTPCRSTPARPARRSASGAPPRARSRPAHVDGVRRAPAGAGATPTCVCAATWSTVQTWYSSSTRSISPVSPTSPRTRATRSSQRATTGVARPLVRAGARRPMRRARRARRPGASRGSRWRPRRQTGRRPEGGMAARVVSAARAGDPRLVRRVLGSKRRRSRCSAATPPGRGRRSPARRSSDHAGAATDADGRGERRAVRRALTPTRSCRAACDVMSSTTRLTSRISLIMREAICSSRS